MLFPKMLGVRDIIINKDNVVLAGNQRTAILKEIVNTTPLDWMVVLQDNENGQASMNWRGSGYLTIGNNGQRTRRCRLR